MAVCRSVMRSRVACRHDQSSALTHSATATSRPFHQLNDAVPTTRAARGTPDTGLWSVSTQFSCIKLEFHDTDTDILARILADKSDARFPEVIPVASSTTHRHSRDDPREDVGEEVRVGVSVGAVECELYTSKCDVIVPVNNNVAQSKDLATGSIAAGWTACRWKMSS